jgi:hypothetical protein
MAWLSVASRVGYTGMVNGCFFWAYFIFIQCFMGRTVWGLNWTGRMGISWMELHANLAGVAVYHRGVPNSHSRLLVS